MTSLLHPVLDRHRHQLRSSFAAWLLAQGPNDVLELGAGGGELMEHLAYDGLRVRGVERSDEALKRARSLGRYVEKGSLDAADFVVPSAEWLVIRHVLHHLEHPERLMLRASAAATHGIMVSEPFSETGLPGHEWMKRLERLSRRLDRKSGMVHRPDLSLIKLRDLIPMDWAIEVRIHAPMTRLPREEVRAVLERSLARAGMQMNALSKVDAEEADLILTAADAGLVCAAGSLVIMATRPSA